MAVHVPCVGPHCRMLNVNITSSLPQLDGRTVFLTDGGIETTLIFHQG